MTQIHNIPPVYNKNSKILILGSFPSVKSRETEFFYAHPQNRFWRVLSELLGYELPGTIAAKKKMLLDCRIALWDVIAGCDIEGSSDSSIRNVRVNDLSIVLNAAKIERIYANGNKAYELYRKYIGENIEKLPSTSPANAAWSLDRLIGEWSGILKYLR